MNLERALLLVLSAAPRALNVQSVALRLPEFTGTEHTIADVKAAIGRLEARTPPHVKGTSNEDLGQLYAITDEGRLRVL